MNDCWGYCALIVPETSALVSLMIPLANRTKGAVVAAAMSSDSSDGGRTRMGGWGGERAKSKGERGGGERRGGEKGGGERRGG